MQLGDFAQLTPLPPGGPVFVPPNDTSIEGSKGRRAGYIKDMFWSDGVHGLNYSKELTEKKRFDDTWYAEVLEQCREGRLDEKNYALIRGSPTAKLLCSNACCATLAERWKGRSFGQWEEDIAQECAECHRERHRRNRLLPPPPEDAALRESDFLDAPYVHQHNEPKYHARLLRAAEYAKRHKKHCLWFRAHDTIMDRIERPKDLMKLQKKRRSACYNSTISRPRVFQACARSSKA